ncbi:DUF262 domain-containing protein [Butyrivibrio sp. AE2032]|uniref:DUF262 domain-containing protein n=1 Tax=Butyrivibrio sp. AE2032 TaxID=1458463 RepID=UPI00054E6CC2|nr:DUF262 domain-containing protein [Butyrivibrio sp. AE2032]
MPTYQPQTIKRTMEDIISGKLILPALQRNFVWPEDKIIDLFDSLVKEYPIGTFLFWDVTPEVFAEYSFSKVLTEVKESRDKKYRGRPADEGRTEYCAILDGQQRITSLAISILGKSIMHTRGMPWDLDTSFVDKYFCLNILHKPIDDDDKYQFRFLPEEEIGHLNAYVVRDEEDNETTINEYWVKVADIYSDDAMFNENNGGLFTWVTNLELLNRDVFTVEKRLFINNVMTTLRNALVSREVVSVYTTPNNLSLNKIVDIFVRVNSGGQRLDDADLILSIASGDIAEENFYDKASSAVEEIKACTTNSFKCDKKFILSVGLLFTNAPSLSLKNPENYSRHSVQNIVDIWDTLIEKIKAAVIFVNKLDFDVSKLSANFFVPIAYYFYKTDRGLNYYESVDSVRDRVYIRQWLFRTMINHIFDEGTGKSLLRMRTVIDEALQTATYFPLDAFLTLRNPIKRPIRITEEQIRDIIDWKWPDYRIIPLLKELSPSIPSGDYAQDHIWPRIHLTNIRRLREATPNLSEAERQIFKSNADFLPNIELLTGNENSQKRDRFFDSWINSFYSDENRRNALFDRNIIPIREGYGFESFISFFNERKTLLEGKITEAFPDDIESINRRFEL